MQEIHEYVRHELMVYVTWFSFYLTLLLTAMAWSLRASLNEDGKVVSPSPFFCMVFLFTVQTILALFATSAVIEDFALADGRVSEILLEFNTQSAGSSELELASPMPSGIHTAMQLMKCTLYTQIVFWPLVAVFVFISRGKKLFGRLAA